MKSGRNEPCPCGSGKKYKKCCLSKDQAAASTPTEAPELEPAPEHSDRSNSAWEPELIPAPVKRDLRQPASPSPDPLQDALYQRWQEFEALDNDADRRNLFLKTLDEPELMDDENAFGMLDRLRVGAIRSGNLKEWEELVDLLRQRLPEVYAGSRKFYLQWNITDALDSGRLERVPALAREMAETAGEDVDIFGLVVDLLAYHGQLEALSEAFHIAWPLIRDSSNILWGQDNYARMGADCIVYQRLEQDPNLDGRDPQLISAIGFFVDDLKPDYLVEYVDYLCGRVRRTWSLDDFQKSARRRKVKVRQPAAEEPSDEEPVPDLGRDALTCFGEEFIGYARREKGISYVKAALAQDKIVRYFRERKAGELDEKPSMLDSMFDPPKQARNKVRYDHPLCPDRETLDRYFGQLFSIFLPQMYAVAATFELFPVWFNFLESKGLLEPAQVVTALDAIAPLQETLLKLWGMEPNARVVTENIEQWPEIADNLKLF